MQVIIKGMEVLARLVQRKNEKTDKLEWALISKKNGRVLKWFGARKPSKESVNKEERRIWHFKTAGSYPTISKLLGRDDL